MAEKLLPERPADEIQHGHQPVVSRSVAPWRGEIRVKADLEAAGAVSFSICRTGVLVFFV